MIYRFSYIKWCAQVNVLFNNCKKILHYCHSWLARQCAQMGIWSAVTPTQSYHSFHRTLNEMGYRVPEVSPFFPWAKRGLWWVSTFCFLSDPTIVQKFQNMKKSFNKMSMYVEKNTKWHNDSCCDFYNFTTHLYLIELPTLINWTNPC